jgi:putative component of toxin-antitoxin plasmid stabilization module
MGQAIVFVLHAGEPQLIILLAGGDKTTQSSDIQKALKLAQEIEE